MLEVKNASVTLNGQLLFGGLSFAVDDGRTMCVTGPSGSGKTTLLRALMGFQPLDGGISASTVNCSHRHRQKSSER